ncbi:DUF3343 domain-containing protein [Candidatus Margulisiibacteriota bacterium]
MVVLIFDSIHQVLKAEKALKANKLNYEIIPTPRDISSDCGSCIRIAKTEEALVSKAFEKNGICAKKHVMLSG